MLDREEVVDQKDNKQKIATTELDVIEHGLKRRVLERFDSTAPLASRKRLAAEMSNQQENNSGSRQEAPADQADGEEDIISDWLTLFEKMPKSVQMEALTDLVPLCSYFQVKHLQAVIAPYFQKDFISLLPKEISLKIIGYLSPYDLVQAAQTSRYWRQLAEDKLLWAEKCRQYSIREIFPPSHCRRENWLIHSLRNCSPFDDTFRILELETPPGDESMSSLPAPSSSSATLTSGALSCFERSRWKAVYLRNRRILNNWRNRRPSAACQLRGHDDHVITCLQMKNDLIVTGSDDNTVRVWSTTTAQCLHVLYGHTGGVWTLQLSEDASTVISGSTDRTVRVWDTASGNLVHCMSGHTSTVRCMALHGNTLVSGSRDCTVRIWDTVEGRSTRTLFGHLAAVRCVQFDGKTIISGAYDFNIIVWNAKTGAQLHLLEGHTNRVYSLLFESDRDLVVSGSLDTTIRVWNTKTGECLQTLIGHQSLTSGMHLRGNTLVSGNADSTIKVWDISNGQCLHTLAGQFRHSSAVTSLQFLENGLVATSSDDGTVKLWDVVQGAFVCDLIRLDSAGSGGCVWRLKATPTMLVCAVGSRNGTEDTKLILFDFDAPYP